MSKINKRYTAQVIYRDGIEEIDVDAKDRTEASKIVREIIKKIYDPGYVAITIRERTGLYY